MQNLLLTIASAIILAIAAAFAAPLVIDWTQWRSTFEAQAARAIGVPVAIRGKIDAQILPTPKLVLRDIAIGSDATGTGLTIGEVQGTFQLSALFRGAFVADHLTLITPRGRLVLDTGGKLALPAKSTAPAGFTASRLTVQNGTLDVTDRTSGRALKLSDIDLAGDVGGIAGPLRLDGEIESAGVRRKLKIGLAAPEPTGGSKLRASLQDLKSPLSLEADGLLRLTGGQPSFDGKASLGLRGPAANAPALRGSDAPGTAPAANSWALSGMVNATPALIEAKQLSLTLGSIERPIELSGSGRLIGGTAAQPANSRLELALAARQIDLNAATANAPPLAALNAIAATIAPLANYAATGALDLSSDTVLISGAAMREVRVGLDWSADGWRARNIEARLPGRASVKLAGRLPQPGQANTGQAATALFTGDVALNAEDLPAFASWAAPESIALLVGLPTGGAKLDAAISIGDARIDLSRMTATMGEVKLTGSAGYTFPTSNARGRADATLATEKVDLDALLPATRRLLALSGARLDVGLNFTGRAVRLAGVDAASVDLGLTSNEDGLGIQRMAITNFGGLNVTGSGRLPPPAAGANSDTDGRFEARLRGDKAEGLPALARAFGFPNSEALLTQMGPMLAPLDVAFTLVSDSGRMDLSANGKLGVLSGTAQAQFGARRELTGRLVLDATDGSAVLGKLGVQALRPKLGPARLTLNLKPQVDAELLFGGASLTARGSLGWDDQARMQPDFALALNDADLARFVPALAIGAPALPARLSGALSRQNETWEVDGLTGVVAGAKIDGRASFTPGRPDAIDADIAMERWSLPSALALIAGKPAAGGTSDWPDGRFGRAPLAVLGANVRLDVRTLDLPGGLALDGAKLKMRIADGGVAVEDISGSLADGRVAGRFDLRRRGDVAQFDGHLSLSDADSAKLLRAASVGRPGVQGRVTVSVDLNGGGRSPRALAAALSGQGSIVIDGLEIAGTDPYALQYAMQATANGMPPEQRRMMQLLDEGFSRGVLKLDRVETALSVVNGVARSGSARLAIGDQRFALSGNLDVGAMSFEATLEVEDVTDAGSTAAPSASVMWRGPLAKPERRLDITGLAAAINMRALERETRRLEAEISRTPPVNPEMEPTPQPVQPSIIQPAAPAPTPTPAPAPKLLPRAAPSAPASPFAMKPKPAPQPAPYAPDTGAAPPLPPPIMIAPDVLMSPIMRPPLAP